MPGFRDRLVHFYHEISDQELFEICASNLGDLETVRDALQRWIKEHAERIDSAL